MGEPWSSTAKLIATKLKKSHCFLPTASSISDYNIYDGRHSTSWPLSTCLLCFFYRAPSLPDPAEAASQEDMFSGKDPRDSSALVSHLSILQLAIIRHDRNIHRIAARPLVCFPRTNHSNQRHTRHQTPPSPPPPKNPSKSIFSLSPSPN